MNNLHNSVDALTQSIDQINAHMNELIISQRQQQRQQQRQSSSSSHRLQFNDRRLLHFFTKSLNMLINRNDKEKKFRESDIKFFDSTCFETHDKDDYVTIEDKMHYRDV